MGLPPPHSPRFVFGGSRPLQTTWLGVCRPPAGGVGPPGGPAGEITVRASMQSPSGRGRVPEFLLVFGVFVSFSLGSRPGFPKGQTNYPYSSARAGSNRAGGYGQIPFVRALFSKGGGSKAFHVAGLWPVLNIVFVAPWGAPAPQTPRVGGCFCSWAKAWYERHFR